MTQRLFVYGTLVPGGPNEHVLTSIGGTWEEAIVRGFLKQKGWGAEMGYPGIVLDDAGDEINGFIFISDHLENHWDELDDFEGKEYKRVSVIAETKDGTSVHAFIYMLRKR